MKDEVKPAPRAATARIRDLREDDLPALAAMVTALARHHGDTARSDLATLRRDLLGPAPWLRALVAEGETGLLGYAALCPRAQLHFGLRGMDLSHLYVAPVARGKGLGRQLIEAAADHARRLGCSFMTVETTIGNWHAQTVYRACGFEPAPHGGSRFHRALAPASAQAA